MNTIRLPWVAALLAAVLLPALPLAAQAPAAGARSAVYLELLGSGGLYSVNAERRVGERMALRLGVGHWTAGDLWSDAETTITSVPLVATWLMGPGVHRAEVGAGVLAGRRRWEPSPGAGGQSTGFVSLNGVVGYRYQPAARGWLFRIGFTPFYGFGNEEDAYPDRGFLPSLGVSGGYAF